MKHHLIIAAAAGLAVQSLPAQDPGRSPATRQFPTGNVIFFHPDGTGLNHWQVARTYWAGPDGALNWDLLPNQGAYRGHMKNTLTGTSNGGATTHAFGFKVDGLGSFGKDGDGNLVPPTDRFIRSLGTANDPLGYPGSIMREAANVRNMPVGVVNDGNIGEPGTGCFLAEVGNRDNWQEIVRQMLQGRPGFNDVRPHVIFGGGECDLVPTNTPTLHRNWNQARGQALNRQTGLRTDGLNLINELTAAGYRLVRTRAEFEALRAQINAATGPSDPNWSPKVLGIFGWHHMFNDRNEEDLIARGFRDASRPVNSKQSQLVLWGDFPRGAETNTISPASLPSFNPPTFAEMTDVAVKILDRESRRVSRPFLLVAEQEANDNFGNSDNAVGMLAAMRDTDNALGVVRSYIQSNPRTLVVTAADSDAGGMQLRPLTRMSRESVLNPITNAAPVASGTPLVVLPPTTIVGPGEAPNSVVPVNFAGTAQVLDGNNPATGGVAVSMELDGLYGRRSQAFLSEPDQFGQVMQFGIAWSGTGDYMGGMTSRAAGLNAGLLTSTFATRFDNIDVYRLMYATLFGQLPNYPSGLSAPTH
jgi:alkaline phosphatase